MCDSGALGMGFALFEDQIMKKNTEWRKAPGFVMSLSIALAFSLGLTGQVKAQELSLSAEQPTVIGQPDGPSEMAARKPSGGGSGPGVYIIQFDEPSVAMYTGGIAGFEATSRNVTGEKRLNTNSKAAKKYAKRLKNKQYAFIADCDASLGHLINVSYTYQHALNGVAIELTPEEAESVAGMPGVKSVSRERMEVPLTDAGPAFIGAPSIWTNPPDSTQGEGVVVAVLDTGINHDHPSYADIGGDGFDHDNPLGSGNYLPGSYCDVTDPSFCNDKLIGAWSFVAEAVTPEDSDGHGSHTASTAAGNVVDGATLITDTTMESFDISGVARHANIIMYDVCIDDCPGAALVAAINQVIIDSGNLPNGIAALNYSISGGGNPYNDPVELGFLAAVAAGVYVSASAGNAGPGPSTVAHLGPWVSTTAASTHNRAIVNALIDLTSGGGGTPDIGGLGFTSGFGPAPIINSADLEGAFPGSTLCGLGVLGSFIPPWPAGTFSGEIVACTRGAFGRVEKGANVLAAGAGGYVLMDNGAGLVADAHVLPAVHISLTDRASLEAWLAANVANSPIATIAGFSLDLSPANGDVMAGFSSRGPQTAFDVLKPDVTAPGVSVFAAEADGQALPPPPEYQFLSGTSMSSPHNAGSGALMTALHPDWSPQEIKSALMMTSTTQFTVKEDGATPTDHFDLGAGRLELGDAKDAGLIMNESIANFVAANPDLGGDPSSLNVASMQNSACVGKCKWRRTVTGVNSGNNMFDLSTSGPAGLGLTTNPASQIVVGKNKSKEIIVNVDTTFATPGWNFANLHIEPQGFGPDLHMPIAVFAADTTDGNLFNKSVDQTSGTVAGDTLNYEISITNGQLAGEIELEDPIPLGTTFVAASETILITDGATISSFAFNGSSMTWTGELDLGGIDVTEAPAPFGYLPLSIFFAPFVLPANCDDGGFIIGTPPFTYNGGSHSSVIWSVNGTVEAGTASGIASSFSNQNLPDPTTPNNILAPFWRDLNLCAGGNWYVGVLGLGPLPAPTWTIFEWENVPHFGSPDAVTTQIWIGVDGTPVAGDIHYTYNRLDNTSAGATVGAENATGTVGDSYFFNGAGTPPAVGTDLGVFTTEGGTATFGFEVTVNDCSDTGIVNEAQISNHGVKERAMATSTCAP